MSMRSLSRSLIVVTGVLFLGISQTRAQSLLNEYFETAEAAIPNRFSLSVFEEVRYKDNINSSASRKTGSFINEAGITLDWYRNLESSKYGIIGDISYEYYDKNSHDLNDFTWNISPFVLGNIDVFGNDSLMITLSSRSITEKYDSSDTTHTTHIDNSIGLTYDIFKFARWGIALSSRYNNKYYTDSQFKNNSYQAYQFGVAPYYKVSEKVKIGINNSYKERHYRNSRVHNDSKSYEVKAFVDYRQSSKFSIHLGAGASKTEYEGQSHKTNGDREWQPTVSATFRYTPATNFVFSYISSLEWEDTGSARGGRMAFYNSLRTTWQITQRISFSPGVSIEQQDERNSLTDTTEYSVFAHLDYDFSKRMSFYLGYEYEHTKYKYLSNRDYEANECWLGMRFSY